MVLRLVVGVALALVVGFGAVSWAAAPVASDPNPYAVPSTAVDSSTPLVGPTPVIPEAPVPVLLPLSATAAALATVLLIRRKPRREAGRKARTEGDTP